MEKLSRFCGKLLSPALLIVVVLIGVDVTQRVVTNAVQLEVQIGLRDELAEMNGRK